MAMVLLSTFLFLTSTLAQQENIILQAETDVTLGFAYFQERVFRSKGLWWVFYKLPATGVTTRIHLSYSYSSDGKTWSKPIPFADWGSEFAVTVNDGKIEYVRITMHEMLYRKGQLESEGAINWLDDEQKIDIEMAHGNRANIMVDSAQRAIITYGWGFEAYVTKNSATDGRWITQAGYPKLLGLFPSYGNGIVVDLASLSSNQFYVMYGYYVAPDITEGYEKTPLYGRILDSTTNTLGEEETITMDMLVFPSMVSHGNIVYIAFESQNRDELFMVRKGGEWSTSVLRSEYTFGTFPTLSLDHTTGYLYCVYFEVVSGMIIGGSGFANEIHYRVRQSSGWGEPKLLTGTTSNAGWREFEISLGPVMNGKLGFVWRSMDEKLGFAKVPLDRPIIVTPETEFWSINWRLLLPLGIFAVIVVLYVRKRRR